MCSIWLPVRLSTCRQVRFSRPSILVMLLYDRFSSLSLISLSSRSIRSTMFVLRFSTCSLFRRSRFSMYWNQARNYRLYYSPVYSTILIYIMTFLWRGQSIIALHILLWMFVSHTLYNLWLEKVKPIDFKLDTCQCAYPYCLVCKWSQIDVTLRNYTNHHDSGKENIYLDNAKRGIPSQGGKIDLELWPCDPKSIE